MKKEAGFTLTEMLIAGVIFVGLLGLMTAMFSDAKGIHDIQKDFSEKQDSQSAAFSILEYELSLAGYRGTDLSMLDARNFNNLPTISIESSELGFDSNRITVRYYEDRWTNDGTQLVEAMFFVEDGKLKRLDLNSTNPIEAVQVVALDVSSLRVTHYYDLDGTEFEVAPQDKENLGGLGVEVVFNDGSNREIVVGFSNKQQDYSN